MSKKAQAIESKIQEILSEQLGIREEEIKSDANFIEDLGADSLDIVELIMAMEEEFELEIPDEDAEKIMTVQNCIDYVLSKLQS